MKRYLLLIFILFILMTGISRSDLLYEATSQGNYIKVKSLLEGHPLSVQRIMITRINYEGPEGMYGRTPLHAAVVYGYTNIVKYFISKGCNIDIRDKYGYPPLLTAISEGNYRLVKFLISKGANVKRPRLLRAAAINGNLKIVKLLLKKKVNINERDQRGCTPLHCAASNGNLDVVAILIYKGANINARDKNGKTPLYYANNRNHKETSHYILLRGGKE